LLRAFHIKSHTAFNQTGDERWVQCDVALRSHRFKARPVVTLELDRITLRHDSLHLIGLNIAQEI
jgi:hypothetical protein